MRIPNRLLGAATAVVLLSTAACTTNAEGERRVSTKGAIGGVVGAVVGYFGGDLIGGRRDLLVP